MKNRKTPSSQWISSCLMALGVVLLLAAGYRVLRHQIEQNQAAKTSSVLLSELKNEPPATAAPTPAPTMLPTLPPNTLTVTETPSQAEQGTSAEDLDQPGAWQVEEGDEPEAAAIVPSETDLPSQLVDAETMPKSTQQPHQEINGRTYIGSIAVPALEIELPVQSQWDYVKLKETPCYYQGAVDSSDLVLMAHNYDQHFGMLVALPKGSEVQFTDIYQKQFTYQLTETVTVDPDHPEKLDEGNWDLTLFTCTPDGLMRVMLRFIRTSA